MSRKNSDDFFGIEYDSPVYSRDKEEITTNVIEKTSRYVPPVSYASEPEDLRPMTGTEYLDEAFFPGVHDKYVKENDGSPHFDFYDQMNRTPVAPRTAGRKDQETSFPPRRARKQPVISSQFDREREAESPQEGLNDLRSSILPVWHMKEDELINLMCSRLIHADNNIVAFDKPFGLSYSGGPSHRPQFDRILQNVKMQVAPRVERLHLVKSLDRNQSGVILFATNKFLQDELRESMSSGLMTNRHKCIVRGKFADKEFSVNIPLVKKLQDRNLKMMPLLSNKTKDPIFHVESQIKVNSTNDYASYVEVITKNEAPHQVRCHLHLAGCPLIGDFKYGGDGGRPPKLSDRLYSMLNVTENQSRKIPIYAHLQEVSITKGNGERIAIHTPIPDHFNWMLLHLNLGPPTGQATDACDSVPCSSTAIVKFKCSGVVLPSILYLATNYREHMISIIKKRREEISDGCDIVVLLRMTSIPEQQIDFSWENRVLKYFTRMMELERVLWNLSTLGGAYSAMGDFDEKHAEVAAVISTRQLKIATELGDPALAARCYLYMALSRAQRGDSEEALFVVRVIRRWAHCVKNDLLIRCCQGIHMKVKSIEKQYILRNISFAI